MSSASTSTPTTTPTTTLANIKLQVFDTLQRWISTNNDGPTPVPFERTSDAIIAYISHITITFTVTSNSTIATTITTNNNERSTNDDSYYVNELLWRMIYSDNTPIDDKSISHYLAYDAIEMPVVNINYADEKKEYFAINYATNEAYCMFTSIYRLSLLYSNPKRFAKYICYQCGALKASCITEADSKQCPCEGDADIDPDIFNEIEVGQIKCYIYIANTDCKCTLIGEDTTSTINLLPLCLPVSVNYYDTIGQFTITCEKYDNLVIIKGLLCNLLTTTRDLNLLWKPMPSFVKTADDIKFHCDNVSIIGAIFDIIIENSQSVKPLNEINLYCKIICKITQSQSTDKSNIIRLLYATVRYSILNFMKFKFMKSNLIAPELNIYEITNNSNELKAKFDPATNDYLFHGSPMENWYPIMYNGLRNASGTSLQLNGAVYGNGIYMADDINVSIGYCGYHYGYPKSGGATSSNDYRSINGKNAMGIIGVFQVFKPKKEYLKTYYVIPNEDECILRYIIIVDSDTNKYIQHINGYFTELQVSINKIKPTTLDEAVKQAIDSISNSSATGSSSTISHSSVKAMHKSASIGASSATKRIMKEIELLQSSSVNNPVRSSPRIKAVAASTQTQSQAQPSIKYDIEYGDNVYVITVKFYVDNFKDSKILLEQMKSKNIDYITVEIILNDKFPFEPPFLRVVKPIFKQLTGHITLGGSICHEILSSTGWTATTKLLQLLEFIVVEINQGKPELDMETRKTEYGLEEAKQAYSRMLSSHGWK